jgi:hypothetical protein
LKKLEIEYTDKVFKYQMEDLKINAKQLKKAVTGVDNTSFFNVADEIIIQSLVKMKMAFALTDPAKTSLLRTAALVMAMVVLPWAAKRLAVSRMFW